MFRFQLTKIVLKNGDTVVPAPITLIVGPNNAGKSRFLKEIAGLATKRHTGGLLVKDLESSMPTSLEELRNGYDVERQLHSNGSPIWGCLDIDLCHGHRVAGGDRWPEGYDQFPKATTDVRRFSWFFSNFGMQLLAYLTTEHRLQIVSEINCPDNEQDRSNLLHELYYRKVRDDQDLRTRIKESFGFDIALDFSTLKRMLFRIGGDFSGLPGDPRDAFPILSTCEKLDDQGDGLRAFVGIIVAFLALRRDVFLIDEPETFLHPPQAFRIGVFLGEQAKLGRQIIAATHSADVLRGVLSSGAQVKILRIDRVGNTNTFRTLDTEQIKTLVIDPLLSSARVLDGLFYSGAVVVEADADARFYHTVSTKSRQDLDLHFVNADNKQTVPRIMGIYRDLGVRCVGIVDFDVLNNATEFEKQLDAIHLEETDRTKMNVLREQIARVAKETPPADRLEAVEKQLAGLLSQISDLRKKTFSTPDEEKRQQEKQLRTLESRFHELADTTKSWREFKQRGRSALPPEAQSAFDQLYRICAARGLFINPCGELESMLVDLGIPYTSEKKQWITTALRLLPSLTVDETKSVWRFMKEIHSSLALPMPPASPSETEEEHRVTA